MADRGRKPTIQSIAEELAIECMARAREDALRALDNKAMAARLLEMLRADTNAYAEAS